MKKKLTRGIAAAAAACLCLCAPAWAKVELIAVNVGKGDALLLRTEGYTCLIDTGKSNASEQLEEALKYYQVDALDAVFITHTDKDHAGGLKKLRKSGVEIRAIYASRYHPETSTKDHQAVEAAEKLDLEVNWLSAGDEIALNDSVAVLRVLAPIREIPGSENDNSLVMMLDSPDGRVLLTGDMEYLEEMDLLNSGADLRCNVLKVPNHGDGDACSPSLIAACSPQLALISTNSEEKNDTPDKVVVENLKRSGCEVYVTQDSKLGVRVLLKEGTAEVEYVGK